MRNLFMYFQSKNLFHEYVKLLNPDHFTKLEIFRILYSLLKQIRILKKNIKKFNLQIQSNLQLVKNIRDLSNDKIELLSIKDRYSSVNSPVVFNTKHDIKSINSSVLDIDLYLLNNVYLYAKSSLVSDGKLAFSSTLHNYQPHCDIKNSLRQSFVSFQKKQINIHFKKIDILDDEDVIYIHLLNEHSANYYHWLYELMPKLILMNNYIMSNENYNKKKYILIIDKNLYTQMLEIIKMIVKFEYQIKELEEFDGLFCSQLLFCSDFWLSLDNTRFKPNIISEFFVDKYAVTLIRDTFKEYLSHEKPYRKVYLERKGARQLLNEKEIKKLLLKFDFEYVDTSLLTFTEQIKLFSETLVVVGTSGAAFSNIIFMNNVAKAIIFTPNCIAINLYIFQQMADVAEIELIHILSKNKHEYIHSDIEISLNELDNVLNNVCMKNS